MKNLNFLNELVKRGKLGLVNVSEEIKQSYLEKSLSNLSSAKILLENDKLEESVSLVYYSMYNTLLALLFGTGIKSENHTGSISLLKEIFDLDNSKILIMKKERIQTQYYVNFHIKEKEVRRLIKDAEEFNDLLLDFISKLTNDKINFYRDKFIKLLNL